MRNIRPLTTALAKKASEELNENPDDVQFYLEALKHWLLRQRHLKPRTQDQFLIAFLRGSKFSLEKCKQKIDRFYAFREMMPELFRDRDPNDPKVSEILRRGAVLHIPQPISDAGPRIAIFRVANSDFQKYTVIDVFRVGIMIADLCLYDDDHAIVGGYVFIMDLTNITPSYLFYFDPMFVKKITIMANKVMPSRMKGFHFINMLPVFEKSFNMVKSVINKKLQNRFFFHGTDLNSLYEHVPQHCLPVEYGGGSISIQDIIEHWETKLKKNSDFFIEEDNYGCDEKLREDKLLAPETLFGVEGSFRKLNVD